MSYLFSGASDILEIRDFVGASNSSDLSDTEILNAISYAEAEICDSLGYQFGSTNVVEKYDGTGDDTLHLKNSPIIQCCYLSIDNTILTTDQYCVYADKGFIRLYSGSFFLSGPTAYSASKYQNITVCYDYGSSQALDPTKFLMARKLCKLIASSELIMALDNTEAMTDGTEVSKEKLGDYEITTAYNKSRIKDIKNDIERIYSRLGVTVSARVF